MEISTKDLSESVTLKDGRPFTNSDKKAPLRDREEKLRAAKERQNEERQKKIEELKVQAEAAQRFREQKEEERKRRMEELRSRDSEKRQQVEERKKAILEAEKERKEYILRKNQERDARLDTKKRHERSSIVFAFGSSTPRLLDPTELGTVSPSSYWGHRRSTSISNVAYAGASITRRSTERELADGSKKRATSAGGIDRHNEDCRRKSTSMYEVFNWGFSNDEPPKRYALSIAGNEINIDGPPNNDSLNNVYSKEETTDSPALSYRSVARRKTDLMPTIPSPREPNFGSKSSLFSHTPRTPGRACSMTRLDQLAQPIRRNGEHIRAIIERQKLLCADFENATIQNNLPNAVKKKNMSRSMTHLLTGGTKTNYKQQPSLSSDNSAGSIFRPLRKTDTCKSMTQLTARAASSAKKFLSRFTKVDRKEDDKPNNITQSGSRSGNVTPGGSISNSRPGSAMSTSTTASGLVQRRPAPAVRKPRPASIAVTGVSLDELKNKKDKPPLPKLQSTSSSKRSSLSNAMTSSISRVSSAERKPPSSSSSTLKKDLTAQQKPSPISKITLTKSQINVKTDEPNKLNTDSQLIENQTKDEKNALNAEKTETFSNTSIVTTGIDHDIIGKTVKTNGFVQLPKPETIVSSSTSTTSFSDETAEEKSDRETEKDLKRIPEIRELSADRQENEMTASMIARKITTEDEAKAALAERRRIAREEAERQAELERQRLEAEQEAEVRRQIEEEEKQRQFEEESTRLAEEQRRSEQERLQQAIEEAKKREEEEKQKREEDEKLRVEKEEFDKKAKEEAEKQKIEMEERAKREEKEREERRKRVEAIMSRTRKAGGNTTPNSTPSKENNDIVKTDQKETEEQSDETTVTNDIKPISDSQNHMDGYNAAENGGEYNMVQEEIRSVITYEQSVTDKENALMKNFSNMVIDQNTRNLQNIQNPFMEVTNGKLAEQQQNQLNEIVTHTIANGNGRIENFNNKNDTNPLVDIPSDQLIDFANQTQQITDTVNFNNNNSLMTSPTTLVTADSHENKEISLL